MARIAIIDDLIPTNLLKVPLTESYLFSQGRFNKIQPIHSKRYTHGTFVATIFESYATEFDLINIAILEDWSQQRNISPKVLKQSLEFCLQVGVDAINISAGTERLSDIRLIGCLLYTSPSPRD